MERYWTIGNEKHCQILASGPVTLALGATTALQKILFVVKN